MARERCLEICERYKRAMELGEPQRAVIGQLAAMFDVQRPAIWKALRNGGVLPPYAPRLNGGKGRPVGGGVPGYSAARRERSKLFHGNSKATPDRVDRDPCPRCGVRADIGCNHDRTQLGTIL